jgi:hypothetical protein
MYNLEEIAFCFSQKLEEKNFPSITVEGNIVNVKAQGKIIYLNRVFFISYRFFINPDNSLLDLEIIFFDQNKVPITKNFTSYEQKILIHEPGQILINYI